jgi:phage tail sheath protein FI
VGTEDPIMTNPTYPGVYIEEQSGGPGPIAGVSTSALGLVGWSTKGPTHEPTLCTSYAQFTAAFGTFTAKSLAPTEAFAFFQQGGQQLYFVRASHTDAVDAACFLAEVKTSLTLIEGASASTYTFTMPYSPVVPAGAHGTSPYAITAANVFTCDNGAGISHTFTDNGAGVLTASTVGGATPIDGSIDYVSGECLIAFTTPAEFPAGEFLSGSWYAKTFAFDLAWPGLAGNNYRVTLSGAPDYYVPATASYTRFDLAVDVYDTTNLVWTAAESFAGVVLNDVADANFIATVVNGTSDVLTVTAYNAIAPTALAGALQTNHDVTQTPAYDGAAKAFTYTIGHAVARDTFSMQLGFAATGLPIAAGNPGSGAASFTYTPPTPTQLHPNNAAVPTVTNAGVAVTCTLTSGGAVTLYDDGVGNMRIAAGADITGTIHGTVNYITGVITITPTGTTLTTAAVAVTVYFIGPVITDDGAGNLALTNPCGTYALNSNGTNTIDYALGTATLTWRIIGNPAAGPSATTYPAVSPITARQYATFYAAPSASVAARCYGGLDGSALDRGDVTGALLVADRQGLYAFDKIDAMMSLVIADFQTDSLVCGDVLDYCALRKDKFAIFTVPVGLDPQEAVNWKKYTLGRFSSYAAIYYPHIQVTDPVSGATVNLPCGGHVAGIFARTDGQRNVGKAPAGTADGALAWSLGLERDLPPADVGTCNVSNINCLVSWPYTGRVVWGARMMDISGSEWTYIQQRRLFQYVEKSVFNATHIHVFESNGPQLWGRIKLQLDTFLLGLFQKGYLAGTSPAEAYFVVCDATNNSQGSIDLGITNIAVGIATNKPAEFIYFTFSQKSLV